MQLWVDNDIKVFLYYAGYDLEGEDINTPLGAYDADTPARRAIQKFEADHNMVVDSGIWGDQCQAQAISILDNGLDLSTHFNSTEFGCGLCPGDEEYPYHDEWCLHWPTLPSRELLEKLEALRVRADAPITITSGVRCQTFNDSLPGSVPYSNHRIGRAVDVVIPGYSPDEVHTMALDVGFDIGSYSGNGYTHLQV